MNEELLIKIYHQLLELEGMVLLLKEKKSHSSTELITLLDKKSLETLHEIQLLFSSILDNPQIPKQDLTFSALDDVREIESISITEDTVEEGSQFMDDKQETTNPENVIIQEDEDEIAHTKQNNDLASLFTINDKYRFRRELFGNNNSDLTDTFNLVSAMNSYSEAKDYFIDDLGWDSNSEEVINFMAIIDRYFKSRDNGR